MIGPLIDGAIKRRKVVLAVTLIAKKAIPAVSITY